MGLWGAGRARGPGPLPCPERAGEGLPGNTSGRRVGGSPAGSVPDAPRARAGGARAAGEGGRAGPGRGEAAGRPLAPPSVYADGVRPRRLPALGGAGAAAAVRRGPVRRGPARRGGRSGPGVCCPKGGSGLPARLSGPPHRRW